MATEKTRTAKSAVRATCSFGGMMHGKPLPSAMRSFSRSTPESVPLAQRRTNHTQYGPSLHKIGGKSKAVQVLLGHTRDAFGYKPMSFIRTLEETGLEIN